MTEFLQLDLVPLLSAILACLACGLVGNLLLLTRQSLLGDAISHAVLPGLVLGFWVSGSRASLPMLGGAVLAAVLAAVAIDLVRRTARLETGAAMGVVFSAMFALGLVLIEATGAASVDLDLDCVLSGQLETLIWPAAEGLHSLFDPRALGLLPRELSTLFAVLAAVVATLALLWKELRLAAFDPDFAGAIGFAPRALGQLVLLLTALATVAAFWAVGTILVIAALVGPAAVARLLTDRYGPQFALSAAAAVAMGAGGYGASVLLPPLFGLGGLNAAGLIAVAAGVLVTAARLVRLRLERRAVIPPAA
ncbi:MAG: metal ABC transporter permease [Elioraea sp.]|nr:metal ABC transporter permease [Elioraea sp.]